MAPNEREKHERRARSVAFASVRLSPHFSGDSPQIMQSPFKTRPQEPFRAPKMSCTDTLGTLQLEPVFDELGPKSALFDASCTHALQSAKTQSRASSKLRSS
jgi:hypothetical protein